MKIAKTTLLLASLALAGNCFAQNFDMETTLDERIGFSCDNNPDTIQAGRSNLSLFQQSLQSKDYEGARLNLQWLLHKAPFAGTGIYTQGPYVYYVLITTGQDEAKKLQYFNEMMELFDARENHLAVLNSFAKTKSTLGDVLSVKAEYYNFTAPVTKGCEYTLNKSYDNFSRAIKMVNEKGGREITGNFLQTFFLISDAIYKSAPNAFREQYLQDFLDSKEACEKMLELAKEAKAEGDTVKAQKLLTTYDGPLAAIEQVFSQSGAADHDQLIAIYTKKFDDYKGDITKLNSALTLMSQNDCDDSDIYYQYAEAAYTIEPTFTSAIGLAQKSQKDGAMDKMLEYYNKALELCSSDASRGVICLNISNGLTKSKQFTGALTYAKKAVDYNADLAGKSYLKQANIYTQLGQYNDAIAYCAKASESDITVSGTADRLKENIRKAQANKAANDRAMKEYNDFIARQKAEEAFWGGK